MTPDGEARRRQMLTLLTGILVVNQLDRHIVNICLPAIGAEFLLSDTELGLLAGPAFMIAYVIFGFPLARLAAGLDRRNIVAASVLVWSTLTLLTGAAQTHAQVILLRIGVGVGESGAVAISHAMISDLYPEDRRSSAIATFMTGANVGLLLAFLLGGLLTQTVGWRWAFVVAGLPGLVLAGLLLATTRDPVRQTVAGETGDKRALLRRTLLRLGRDPDLRNLTLAIGMNGIVTFAALTWSASYLIRAHGCSPLQAGIILSLIIGIVGGLGTFLSGHFADRIGRRDARNRIVMMIVAAIAAKPFALLFLFAQSLPLALAGLSAAVFLSSVFWGPTLAHLHARVEVVMRPMATTIVLFGYNVLGIAVGPFIVGLISDAAGGGPNADGLRYGLAAIQIAGLMSAWHYWRVYRSTPGPDAARAGAVA